MSNLNFNCDFFNAIYRNEPQNGLTFISYIHNGKLITIEKRNKSIILNPDHLLSQLKKILLDMLFVRNIITYNSKTTNNFYSIPSINLSSTEMNFLELKELLNYTKIINIGDVQYKQNSVEIPINVNGFNFNYVLVDNTNIINKYIIVSNCINDVFKIISEQYRSDMTRYISSISQPQIISNVVYSQVVPIQSIENPTMFYGGYVSTPILPIFHALPVLQQQNKYQYPHTVSHPCMACCVKNNKGKINCMYSHPTSDQCYQCYQCYQ